jgi:hypothetical protein
MVGGSGGSLFLTSEELSNAIRMDIDPEEKLTILVLEGNSDWRFWSRMCDSREIHICVFGYTEEGDVSNKQLVVDAVYSNKYPLASWRGARKGGILGLVDIDYQHPSIVEVDVGRRLFKEALEEMLRRENRELNADVLEEQVDELRQHIIDTSPNADRDNLLFHQESSTVANVRRVCSATINEVHSALDLAKSIGILRALCDEKKSLGEREYRQMKFRTPDEDKDDREWIVKSITDGKLDKRILFKEILDNTINSNKPSIDDLEEAYEEAEKRYNDKGLSSMELANGHDIACCLSVLCSKSTRLGLSFERACTEHTELESILDSGVVNSIRKWEAENPPYRVLPYDEEE